MAKPALSLAAGDVRSAVEKIESKVSKIPIMVETKDGDVGKARVGGHCVPDFLALGGRTNWV